MKKELKTMIVVIFIALAFVAILLMVAIALIDRCIAQEGCGRWVEARRADGSRGLDSVRVNGSERSCTYWMFVHPDDLSPPDSIWVPEECPEDSLSWKANESFILLDPKVLFLPIMISAVDSLIGFAYQERYQTWRGEEKEKERRCQEVWECVREKLIEFLEEREQRKLRELQH